MPTFGMGSGSWLQSPSRTVPGRGKFGAKSLTKRECPVPLPRGEGERGYIAAFCLRHGCTLRWRGIRWKTSIDLESIRFLSHYFYEYQ